jgi:WD40 repeat protein
LRDRILERALAARDAWLRPLTPSLAAERSIRWLRPAQEETLSQVTFSPNGLWAAHVSGGFGSIPASVMLWDLKEWRSCGPRFQTLARRRPFALALSDDARWCLCADSLGGVYRLSVSGDRVREGHAHRELTIAKLLTISGDGRRALSACYYGRLVAWDFEAGHHEVIWDESDNRAIALSLDAAGDSAMVARLDGSVHLLDLWPARQRTVCKLNGRPMALACASHSAVVAVAMDDGRIEVRSVDAPEPLISIFSTQEQPTSVAVSSDRRYIAVGTAKGTVEVWSLTRGARTARYSRGYTYEVERIAFAHDGARVVSADSLQIKEWVLESGDEEGSVAVGARAAGQVKVTVDGAHAVAVLEDGRLGVWNMRTGALESALPPASGPAFGDPGIGPSERLALAPRAPRILSWNGELLCVWDLQVGASVGYLSVAEVRDAVITPDGRGVVAVNGMDIALWRPDGGECTVLGTYDGDPPGREDRQAGLGTRLDVLLPR